MIFSGNFWELSKAWSIFNFLSLFLECLMMVAVKPLLNTQNAFYTTLVISAYVSVVGLAYITLVFPSVYQQRGKEQKPLSCEAACALYCGEMKTLCLGLWKNKGLDSLFQHSAQSWAVSCWKLSGAVSCFTSSHLPVLCSCTQQSSSLPFAATFCTDSAVFHTYGSLGIRNWLIEESGERW